MPSAALPGRWGRTVLLTGLVFVSIACAPRARSKPPGPPAAPLEPLPAWQSLRGRDHPLVGVLWTPTGSITLPRLRARIQTSRYVLLGEKHDNADHHRLQAWLLGAVLATQRRPAVAFEMIDTDMQPIVDAYLARPDAQAARFGDAVRWASRGWPAWSLYEPIAVRAFLAHLPIVAANAPSADVHRLAFEGPHALAPDVFKRLGLDQPLPDPLALALRDELRAAHCGTLPDEALEPMALAQRARDATMAERLLEGDQGAGVVLVAGAGHVRRDRGIPRELARRSKQTVFSVALVEVQAGLVRPEEYAAGLFAQALPFDVVWFTPRADDNDPCARFSKR